MDERLSPKQSENELRILLWDVDGTILRSGEKSTFTEYTRQVLKAVFGTAGRIEEVPLTGMTDLQFIAEALASEGFSRQNILVNLYEISNRYLAELERATANGAEFHILPGVLEALKAVSDNPRYRSAILTGNFQTTAMFKLNLVGLANYFDVPGACGDQSFDRRELPQLAAQRISSHLKLQLQPSQFIVIGDTPDDIACAHHFGARSISVATGHHYSAEELRACDPDLLLSDLSNTELLMRSLQQL